jgi:predicted GNAT family acetyltransferase
MRIQFGLIAVVKFHATRHLAMIFKTSLLPVLHNVNLQRFESKGDDESLAFLSYTHEGDRVIFDHTFVPDSLRGKGVAATLARAALDEARQRRWKIVARCPFVAGFIERSPEFADLVDRRV